jgi:hypothetical protein
MSHKKYYLKAGLIWLANLPRARKPDFQFDGKTYPYFCHHYNVTWLNERCVEIALMQDIARQPGVKLLEVGNVLSCYDRSLKHTVIDKYETPNRDNFFAEDAETFSTGAPYDRIISISTLEHVGWDESPRDEGKISRTIDHLRSLLTHEGELIFTVPVGYSAPLDKWLDTNERSISLRCLRRTSALNEWEESNWQTVRGSKFHEPYPFANGLVVGRLKS